MWCFIFFLFNIICCTPTVNSSTKGRIRRPQRRLPLIVKTLIKLFYLWEHCCGETGKFVYFQNWWPKRARAQSPGVFWEMRGKFYCRVAMCVCIVLLGVENPNGVHRQLWGGGEDSAYWLSECWRTNDILLTKPLNSNFMTMLLG